VASVVKFIIGNASLFLPVMYLTPNVFMISGALLSLPFMDFLWKSLCIIKVPCGSYIILMSTFVLFLCVDFHVHLLAVYDKGRSYEL